MEVNFSVYSEFSYIHLL